MSQIQQARVVASNGRREDAAALLQVGGEGGDADCWLELAFWHLQGRILPRNLGRARECFGKAADLGSERARMIHISLLANGTGGPADFAGSVRLLREMDSPESNRLLDLLGSMNIDERGDPVSITERRQISDTPQAFLFPAIFSADECRYLVEAAAPAFQPAEVGQLATGRQSLSQVRTCDVAAFPWVAENPVIHALNRRLARAAGVAVECGEPLQILRYRPGQEFKPHRDCTADRQNQRVMTMLVYLNEDYAGGETHFVKTGLKVRGNTGDGLLFRNASDDGTPDMDSIHAGLPVTSGEKLLASRWIRQRPFGPRR